MSQSVAPETPVLAAGALVWREVDGEVLVLLVERTQHRVVEATLHHDPEVLRIAREEFVEPALLDELHGRRPAARNLLLFVQVARRRQHDAVHVAHRILD